MKWTVIETRPEQNDDPDDWPIITNLSLDEQIDATIRQYEEQIAPLPKRNDLAQMHKRASEHAQIAALVNEAQKQAVRNSRE